MPYPAEIGTDNPAYSMISGENAISG